MNKVRICEPVKAECQSHPEDITVLPVRATKTSAGYDFIAVEDLVIRPQEKVSFKTDVKAYMQADEVLIIDVRSSIGTKKDLMITNTLGIIDSDFYGNPENDGNMMIGLRNLKPAMEIYGFASITDINGNIHQMPLIKDLEEENTVYIKKGERVAQGVFMKYLEADNGNTEIERTGGIGSSGK